MSCVDNPRCALICTAGQKSVVLILHMPFGLFFSLYKLPYHGDVRFSIVCIPFLSSLVCVCVHVSECVEVSVWQYVQILVSPSQLS